MGILFRERGIESSSTGGFRVRIKPETLLPLRSTDQGVNTGDERLDPSPVV